jgi:hypothetical protein
MFVAQREYIGRTIMEMWHEGQKPSDSLAEQRASNELVKLIRKLRWMGMEEEAKKAENELIRCNKPAADCVIARSRETD